MEDLIRANFVETNRRLDETLSQLEELSSALKNINSAMEELSSKADIVYPPVNPDAIGEINPWK